MTIKKELNGTSLCIAPAGRLDTTTSPDLEKELQESLEGVTDLTLDFAELEYISSAGLRVLLATKKKLGAEGSMKLVHVNEIVKEVFDVTGFSEILTIE